MPVTLKVSKLPLPQFQPSAYCEWCVTISTTDPAGLGPRPGFVYEWCIDLPADTDILDPEQAKLIAGAPDYKIDPAYGQAKKTQPGQTSIKICFVAACKERNNTEISLEARINPPPGLGQLAPLLADPDSFWERVPFEGGPDGLGRFPGPAPVASLQLPPQPDAFAFLASFEAAKINALLGVQPVAFATRAGTPATRRIRVVALAEPGAAEVSATRRRGRKQRG